MRRPSVVVRIAALVVPLALAAPARLGAADEHPTLSGSWTASSLSERWSITDWGDACGPKPRPQGAPGGAVQITQQGSELSIAGAGRAWSTTQCWEQMPGLSRAKHSASGNARGWQTRCTSAANDPRRATVVTTTTATDTRITMIETGQYQFIIKDTTCTASVSRSRSYTLVQRAGEAPPATSASASAAPAASSAPPPTSAPVATPPPAASEAKPATPRACDAPGEPARLEVTPSRKLMRPGEQFQFRAVVLDAEGCAVKARPTWSVAAGPLAAHATVDARGALAVAADAGEGKLGLVASIDGKGVTVAVEVTSAEKYDALLATRGLNDAGESEKAAVAVIAAGTIGGRASAGDDVARERKNVFVAIVGALAVCLAFAGLILVRRGRRRDAHDAAPDSAAPDSTAVGTDNEGADGNAGPAPGDEAAAPAHTGGDAVAPAGVATAGAQGPARPVRSRGKICPTCGDHYPAEAAFCGKDGTQLVLLNL